MKGKIIFQNLATEIKDKYIEIVLEQENHARLIQCTLGGKVAMYWVESNKNGRYQHQKTEELYQALPVYYQYKNLPTLWVLEVTNIGEYGTAILAIVNSIGLVEVKPYRNRIVALFSDMVNAQGAALNCESVIYCNTTVQEAASPY